ncbi:phosphocholine cytidylyltransferase family protein [Pseudomonadales bacterium]|nr:phosphocholine cytidylyltransferase family protein [Pseudomonadales bacterium]MDB9868751.1 phosphocholine cytidylyltransferase family protein [Pseudomonadales bacterium]
MQAIIMAAGFGSRIENITNRLPKSFLEVNDEKLIERAIRLLREREINDITVVTGYKSELFADLLDDNIKLVFNPLYFCTNVLGSFACGMGNLKDDFIFIHADTIFDETILDDLIASDISDVILPVDYKLCVEEEMKVTTVDGNVTVIHKSIDLNIAEGEFIGIAKINSIILEELKLAVKVELKEKNGHQSYFEAALQNLIDQGHNIKTIATNGRRWIEIDFPEDYDIAQKLF